MSLTVRVIAPTGRDAVLILEALRRNGLEAEACGDILSLLKIGGNALLGPLLIAEEALSSTAIAELSKVVEQQPAWSDLPILILTSAGRESQHSQDLERRLQLLGAPVLLERPIKTISLVSSVRASLRARQRQYEIRDALRQRDDAMSELRRERETLHVMIENLPVGVLLARPDGEIVLGNRTIEQIFRYRVLPEAGASSFARWTAFHADGRPLEREEYPLARAMSNGRAIAPEDYVHRRGDGSLAWLRSAAAPIFDENGVVSGGVVAISDIDQQKRAETALIQSEKLAAVGRLAASISHEINNPLEAVMNLLYLVDRASHEPDVKQLASTAQEQLVRVSQIVTNTLRFHRQSTKPRRISVEELLEPALGLYRGRLRNAHIDLDLQHRGAGSVVCYEGDIRQVLNNLLSNAIDSMRAGGRLIVRTSHSRLRRAAIDGIRITVADTGHGIPEKEFRRIFEPFYTTKGINGTGLGLWISQGIVSKHQGRLQIRSTAGEKRAGTVVSLFLPAEAI